jgi:diguanylate cyclase (GGDEF)-like protein
MPLLRNSLSSNGGQPRAWSLQSIILATIGTILLAMQIATNLVDLWTGYGQIREMSVEHADAALDMVAAMHTNAMLNRLQTDDGDVAIATLNGTIEQASRSGEGVQLWVVMGPKILDYQIQHGQKLLEGPKDPVDEEAIDNATTVTRTVGTTIRISRPAILGLGTAAHEKCVSCHTALTDIRRGEVLGAYSASVDISPALAAWKTHALTSIAMSVGITIVTVSVIFLLLRAIVLLPIHNLVEIAHKLDKNDTRVVIPESAGSRELTTLFRVMSLFLQSLSRAKQLYTDLSKREEALQIRSDQLVEAQRLGKTGDWRVKFDRSDLWWSPQIFELLGYDSAKFVPSREALVPLYEGDGAQKVLAAQAEVLRTGVAKSVDVKLKRGDGSIGTFVITSRAMTDAVGRTVGLAGTIQDISERKISEEKLQSLAYYDPLTGLANRAFFHRELGDVLARCRQTGSQAALLLLDLDHFKEVNDSLGHASGDELLCKVAQLISRVPGNNRSFSRLGGDEFAIVFQGWADRSEIEHLAADLISAVSSSILLEHGEVTIGMSIGIALIPMDGANSCDLQRNADLALYRAKDGGRGRFEFFEPGMSTEVQHKMVIARELRRSVTEDVGLSVHYQPQVSLSSGRVTGFEALMRWTHPTLGNVPPSEFIPVAESSHLICDLGLWILRQAAIQAKAWLDAGEPAREIAINVSAAQIWHTDFVLDVAQILRETDLPPHLLCVELTESLLADHAEGRVRRVLTELKGLGVTLALDDFGTDYSSLGYLTKLPFDKIKIDRIFVDGIANSGRARKLLEGIIALCRGLGMTIVAEGAETLEELAILRQFRCDIVQGYVFARPTIAKEALAVARSFEGQDGEIQDGEINGPRSAPQADLPQHRKTPAAA